MTLEATQRKMINYVEVNMLYLETADHRLFISPYGPRYDDAVGRVYQLVPSGPIPHDKAEANVAFIKLITPKDIFDKEIGEHEPIKVFAQLEHEDGLVLLARIEYGPYKRLADLKSRSGTWLILVLYPESAAWFHPWMKPSSIDKSS